MNPANAARLGVCIFWLGTCCALGEAEAAPLKLNGTLMVDSDVETSFRFSADSSRVLYVADQDSHQVFELYSVPSASTAWLGRAFLATTITTVSLTRPITQSGETP